MRLRHIHVNWIDASEFLQSMHMFFYIKLTTINTGGIENSIMHTYVSGTDVRKVIRQCLGLFIVTVLVQRYLGCFFLVFHLDFCDQNQVKR